MNIAITPAKGVRIKVTKTRCTICLRECEGEVWSAGGKVFMRHLCPEHGSRATVIAGDADFYWHAEGSPENRCCTPVAGGCCGTLGGNALKGGGLYEEL